MSTAPFGPHGMGSGFLTLADREALLPVLRLGAACDCSNSPLPCRKA